MGKKNQREPTDSSTGSLRPLFYPKSVAIIGATNKVHKVGGAIVRNALGSPFTGKIYLVHPTLKAIFGQKVYSSVDELPESVELVEIAVPSTKVPDVLLQAARRGTKAAIIVSAGFAEVGNRELQDQILSIVKEHNIRVLGPNCFGLINPTIDLDLTFSFTKALKGSVAFISQSGAMCCGTLDYAYQRNIGFSKFVNLGNKCDINEVDILEFLAEDSDTEAIALYLEGIQDGRHLMDAAKKVSQVKPIVAVKAGLTEAGARAALSHTASLAGRAEIVRAAFKQSGIVLVDDIEDLIIGSMAAAFQPSPLGLNIGIATNAGGLGVTVADWCQTLGFKVPFFSGDLKQKIEEEIPPFGSAVNPVDMTGDADYTRYREVCGAMIKNPDIHILIAIYTSQGLISSDGPARAIADTASESKKPILALFLGGASITQGERILVQKKVPVFHFPEKVAKAAKILFEKRKTTAKQISVTCT
ncbi:acetate--CoA ligase family protein [[Eubacterium] cellulosolvens]